MTLTIGTRRWMAPEIMGTSTCLEFKSEYNHKCDIYSLGCIFWEMITRVTPFEYYETDINLMSAVARDQHTLPQIENCPKPIQKCIDRMISFDYQKRYEAEQIGRIMKKFLERIAGNLKPGENAPWKMHRYIYPGDPVGEKLKKSEEESRSDLDSESCHDSESDSGNSIKERVRQVSSNHASNIESNSTEEGSQPPSRISRPTTAPSANATPTKSNTTKKKNHRLGSLFGSRGTIDNNSTLSMHSNSNSTNGMSKAQSSFEIGDRERKNDILLESGAGSLSQNVSRNSVVNISTNTNTSNHASNTSNTQGYGLGGRILSKVTSLTKRLNPSSGARHNPAINDPTRHTVAATSSISQSSNDLVLEDISGQGMYDSVIARSRDQKNSSSTYTSTDTMVDERKEQKQTSKQPSKIKTKSSLPSTPQKLASSSTPMSNSNSLISNFSIISKSELESNQETQEQLTQEQIDKYNNQNITDILDDNIKYFQNYEQILYGHFLDGHAIPVKYYPDDMSSYKLYKAHCQDAHLYYYKMMENHYLRNKIKEAKLAKKEYKSYTDDAFKDETTVQLITERLEQDVIKKEEETKNLQFMTLQQKISINNICRRLEMGVQSGKSSSKA